MNGPAPKDLGSATRLSKLLPRRAAHPESGTCECGHAKADHLRGVGCCIDAIGIGNDDPEFDCGCGVFRPSTDPPPQEWSVQVTTADGRGSFRVRAAPDASPELRDALHAIAQEAFVQLAKVTK